MDKLIQRHRKLFKIAGIVIIIFSLPAVINIPIILSQGARFEFDMLVPYLGLIFGIKLLKYIIPTPRACRQAGRLERTL